jgi:hypothetical protein
MTKNRGGGASSRDDIFPWTRFARQTIWPFRTHGADTMSDHGGWLPTARFCSEVYKFAGWHKANWKLRDKWVSDVCMFVTNHFYCNFIVTSHWQTCYRVFIGPQMVALFQDRLTDWIVGRNISLTLTGLIQWFRLALSNGPNWVGVSCPLDGNRSSLRKVVFFCFLEYRAMDKVQKASSPETHNCLTVIKSGHFTPDGCLTLTKIDWPTDRRS